MDSSELDRWLKAARNEDRQAVETICSFLQRLLIPGIKSGIPRGLDAEDVFADALAEILQILPNIDDGEDLIGEAWRAVRRVTRRWERGRHRTFRFDWRRIKSYEVQAIDAIESEDFLRFIRAGLT